MNSLALPLAYVGATLGVAMVAPQLIRTVRHPSLTGVSAASWGLTAMTCLAWLTYGVRTVTVPQIPGNVLLVSGAVAIVLLVPSPVARARRAAILGLGAAAIVGVGVVIPAQSVGYLAFSIGLFAVWPQLFESFANWREGVESGVSITTWTVKLASQASWLSYALLATDIPVAISATFALTATLAIFSMEASRRLAGGRRRVAVAEAG